MKIVYVLLDGIGDLPHPSLNYLTPLEAAYTPNLDRLARRGVMGRVYSVDKHISPESDIAVFSMLGYRFKEEYVGRGVIEAIGANMDFEDGNLALRGNFATIDNENNILDRRVGRSLSKEEATKLVDSINKEVQLTNAEFKLVHTTGHRVVLVIKSNVRLSSSISNTDPAYERLRGMGVAKENSDMRLQPCKPLNNDESSELAARLVNEFTDKTIKVLRDHEVNLKRRSKGMLEANCILLRDAGNKVPKLKSINELYNLRFVSIVDMPVEKGISKVLNMEFFEVGNIHDYETKAERVNDLLKEYDVVYVHLKGPDEFGHDGDAWGKKKNIEEIDSKFFGRLNEDINLIISGDHSTPCIKKGHSADPVPLLISSKYIRHDGSARFTEYYARHGILNTLMGYQVLSKGIEVLRSGKV